MDRRILPLCFLFFITIFGYEISSTFVSLHLKMTGVSNVNIGLMFSFWPLFVIISAPISGILSDRIGRKWFLILSSIGYASFGFLIFLNHFILAFIILGISNGFLWTIGRAYVLDVGKGTKSKEVSIFWFSAVLGSILGAPLSGLIVEKISYSFSFLIGGFIVLLGSLISIIILKESKTKINEKVEFKFSKNFAVLGFLIVIISILGPTGKIFLPILMNNVGIGVSLIGIVIMVSKISTAFSAFVGSRVYDRFGDRFSILSGHGIISLSLFITGIAFALPEFLLAGVLGGLGGSITEVTRMSFLGKITKSYGTGSGIYEIMANIGQWLGTWATAIIAEIYGLRNLFFLLAGLVFVSSFCILLTKVKRKKI